MTVDTLQDSARDMPAGELPDRPVQLYLTIGRL
jgi:hypothetical protein